MATGKHGEYRQHKFRGRDIGIGHSGRKELHQDGRRDGDNVPFPSKSRGDVQERVRDRLGVVKDRVVNGSYKSSTSSSNSSSDSMREHGYRRRRESDRLADKEPGELSSGSSSDDADVSDSSVKENGALSMVEVARTSPTKKRKFSPIVWDRDDGTEFTVAVPPISTESEIDIPLPPPPPLPRGFVPSSGVTVEATESKSPADEKATGATLEEQFWTNDHEPGQVDEEDDYYSPPRNISSSRWADGNNAFDEEEAGYSGDTMTQKKGRATSDESALIRLGKRAPTPELGEVILRECSEGATSRSSDSKELVDKYHELDVEDIDHMLVDKDDEAEQQLDVDSEVESYPAKASLPVQPPHRSINMLEGCRSVDEFERLNKINEGTYGIVYRAKDKKTGEIVALKKVKMEKEREGFPLTSLREINILLSLHHPSIVDVKEVVVGSSLDSIFMVMEYMEHDLKGLMEIMKQPFSQSEVKCLMLQLFEGIKYLHDNWVLHRDLKTSNLLLNNCGELKICDFGLARQYGSPLKPYTHLVVTLWYRSPELLLGAKEYSTAIDMWSLGCIMAELLAKEPLFSGKTEFDQLDKIFRILGTPNEKIWPGFGKLPGVKVNFVKQPYNKLREKFPPTSFSGRPTLSEAGFDLLNKLLTYDPEKRITADEALNHEWFREVPLPKSKDFMPTFPAQHAQDRRVRRMFKSPDPLEEQRKKELQQGEIGTGGLFG